LEKGRGNHTRRFDVPLQARIAEIMRAGAERAEVTAVAGHARSAALPDVPTAAESGLPGFEATFYYGLSAPAGTPHAIIEQLSKELRSMIESEEMTKWIVANGGDPIASTPEEYAANIEREEGKWSALIKKLGLKIE
jgi:tripartite-type tricarboxylate transporter receptor subunit TctC